MNSIETNKHICTITLDNKPHNLLKQPAFIDPKVLLEKVRVHKCKAILITGAGRHFSSGADLKELFELVQKAQLQHEIEKGQELLETIKALNIPVIACIEGACFGGALEIALNADIRLASKKAMFAFPETNHDIIPGLGGIYSLTQKLGKARAFKIILSGNILDAQTAEELGIVDELLPPKTTLEAGTNLASWLTSEHSLDVINAVTELIRASGESDYNYIKDREIELFCNLAQKALQQK